VSFLSQSIYMKSYFIPAPDKENQDAYSIHHSFGKGNGGVQQSFFGVFDGHGKDGHLCARFVRDKVAQLQVCMLFS
jgi:serine/threonine protein phosphatase PrpC